MFRRSEPFDGSSCDCFSPPPTLVSPYCKALQVYHSHCCPFFVALRSQKPDLVPDLIPPGGLCRAPSCPNIWLASAAFCMSVVNIVKELPVPSRGWPASTGNDEMYCLCVKSFKSSRSFQHGWILFFFLFFSQRGGLGGMVFYAADLCLSPREEVTQKKVLIYKDF